MEANLAANLTDTASRFGDRTAIRLGHSALSFRTLDSMAGAVAALLRERGVEPGDRVGVMLPNVPYFVALYYGILRAGGVVVPMNVLLKEREVAYYLEDSGAKLLFAWHDFEAEARPGAETAGAELVPVAPGPFEEQLAGATADVSLAPREAGDTAVILYTSGTTGVPKGAELTHANLRTNAEICSDTLFETTEEDVFLGALPLFHTFGQTCCMNVVVRAGACLSMIPRFDPEVALETIRDHRVTVFAGVPTMFNAMLHAERRPEIDTSTLRLCISGGAAMPEELMRSFERELECIILEGYGLSETSPVASFNHPDRERKPGSIGTPIAGVEMMVVDDDDREVPQGERGEIVIRGHNVMRGYWNRPEATEESIRDGWFHSGDIAHVDEDGYFFIVDRKKDMIIRGGYNVYPREIEEILYAHPAVLEAAVVGVPHESLGEEVAAAVVLVEGAEATEEEIREHVKAQVAAYKYPRHVWFSAALPKGPTGKILKREIAVPDAVFAA